MFRGYYGDEGRATDDFEGDWFRTGDSGAIDDAFLSLGDRKKEIIVTTAGKNVRRTCGVSPLLSGQRPRFYGGLRGQVRKWA